MKLLKALLILGGWSGVANPSTAARGDDFAAPTTISKEAQAALAKFSRVERNAPFPAATDVEAWKKKQAEVKQKRAAANLYEGMWHIFQVFNHDLPESKLARKKVRAFLEDRLGK